MTTSVQKVHLLLQSTSQIFNLFLLFLQIYIHLFGLCSQSRILISRDIILYLQIAVHIANFFLFSLSENGRLISLSNILIIDDATVVELAPGALHRADWHIAAARKQDIARAVIVNNLLVDS